MVKMNTLYLLRHGETFATKNNSGYGVKVFSAPILETGKPVLIRMGQYLKNCPTDFNVSSPLKRCKQTVQIIGGEADKTFVFDKRISEFFLETRGQLKKRVTSLLNEIEEKNYQNVAICTHQAIIAMLLKLLHGKNYEKLSIYNYPYPGILLIINKETVQEIDFNQTP